MELAIYNINGQDTGRKAQLNDQVFAIDANEHAVYLDVKQFLANQRQGTHKSKERSEVSGSTRKLHKQKGGGGARIGDINSPVLVGGGRVFGPRPRDYRFKLNKKSEAARPQERPHLQGSGRPDQGCGKLHLRRSPHQGIRCYGQGSEVEGKKILLVLNDRDENVYLSMRNVPNANIITATDVNTYAIMHANAILITEDSLNVLNNL